jgi:hypothetical protein
MKNATAISQGSSRLLESTNGSSGREASIGLGEVTFGELGCIDLRGRVYQLAENQLSPIRKAIRVVIEGQSWARLSWM